MSEIKITFPGGNRVNVEFSGPEAAAQQPSESCADGSATSSTEFFLKALASCAGMYVLSFCQQRQIDTDGLELSQYNEFAGDADGNKRLVEVRIEIDLPAGFPDEHRGSIAQAIVLCPPETVTDPPEIVITAQVRESQTEGRVRQAAR